MTDEERTRCADELRHMLLEDCHKTVRVVFKKHKPLRSVGLLVAQYWDDEAEDAVHERFICSELETPDVDAALGRGDVHSRERDYVNLPSFKEKRIPPHVTAPWDPAAAVPAFAAYCTEGGDQSSPARDNYSLAAVFSRGGGVQLVATKRRPHLDGHPVEAMRLCLTRGTR
ncbi:MAG: hypothetical protein AB8H86_16915 [Polyangiales bacterium]